jgi:hypothetical protein
VEPISAGRLSPAVRLQVYGTAGATSVGATIPAAHAEELAEQILAAGRMAARVFALTEQGPGAA